MSFSPEIPLLKMGETPTPIGEVDNENQEIVHANQEFIDHERGITTDDMISKPMGFEINIQLTCERPRMTSSQ